MLHISILRCGNPPPLRPPHRPPLPPSAFCRHAPSRKARTSCFVAHRRAKAMRCCPPERCSDAAQIALAASCGCAVLKVYARPRVAILSTGDELVPIAAKPKPGQIRNSSSAMLAAMVSAAGGTPWILPIARDTAKSLDAAIARAATADLLLITGGVSAGKFDLVEPALARAGARFHFTGVRMQPGKPVVFGELPPPFHESQTKSPDQRHAVLFRTSRQSHLFRRHVPALRCADSGRARRPHRSWPALRSRAPGRGRENQTRPHALSTRRVHVHRTCA